MGIINTTPDSFSDGGQYNNIDNAFNHAKSLIDAGADMLDIGGESTRPGAKEVAIDVEIARTIPVIEKIRTISNIPISIDTRKPEVAQLAIKAGANIWNDVSALTFSPHSIAMAAELNVPIVLMHFQGLPENMQENPNYKEITTDILGFLTQRAGAAIAQGVRRQNIIIDIGIGFGKKLEHNLEIIGNLEKYKALGFPLLLGASRKSMIAMIDDKKPEPNDRIGGSLAIALLGAQFGADILRVHDVKETVQAMKVRKAILEKRV